MCRTFNIFPESCSEANINQKASIVLQTTFLISFVHTVCLRRRVRSHKPTASNSGMSDCMLRGSMKRLLPCAFSSVCRVCTHARTYARAWMLVSFFISFFIISFFLFFLSVLPSLFSHILRLSHFVFSPIFLLPTLCTRWFWNFHCAVVWGLW